MPASLAIHRLSARTPARAQPVAARLALQSLGADLEDALPHGLPPQALLWLRRLRLQAPEAALLRPAPVAWRQDWIAAGRAQMDAALAQAARPALGPVPESAPAVLFADAAEMLACLALAAQAGQLDRWWWRGLLGRAWPRAELAWAARPEAQAAAVRLLARAGQGGAAQAWGEGAWMAQVPLATEPAMADRVSEAAARAPRPADVEWPLAPASRGLGAAARRAAALSPVERGAATSPPQEALPAGEPVTVRPSVVALTGRRAVAAGAGDPIESTSAGQASRATASPAADVRHDQPPPAADAATQPVRPSEPSLPLAGRAAFEAGPASRAAQDEAGAPFAEPASPLSPPQAAAAPQRTGPASPVVPQTPASRGAATVSPSARAAMEPVQIRAPAVARDAGAAPLSVEPEAEVPAAWPWPQALLSRQAPLLFLVNALLEDGLYPDFTRPRDPGLPVPLWRLLAELARTWRLPDDPLQAVLRERCSGRPVPDAMPAVPGAAAGPWPGWLAAYARSLRRRLCRRLGIRVAAWPQALSLARPARLWLSEADWVAEFDLGSHDVAWRLAGLDRDPGWLPSTGVSLRFAFVL